MRFASRFRAMGTDIDLVVDAEHSPHAHTALMEARRLFDELEAKLSRFRPDSELSRLNRDGVLVAPSDELRGALELALEARRTTNGRFDPSVLAAVIAAGYDRTFDELPAHVQGRPACPSAQGTPATIDPDTLTIHLAPGVGIDLGGIAKGLAAELAADMLAPFGPCLVSAGGDIAVRGVPASGDWPVAITLADGQEAVVGLTGGAMATSGRDRRSWTTTAGSTAHHVIDPATGRPAETDVVRITVFAATAVDAETTATALMISGSDAAMREAAQLHVDAIVVTDDGRTLMTEGLS